MSQLDMSEAVRMLANEKNISVDALLQVLADALALAYKRRPGAAEEVVVEVNPDTLEFHFTAYDVVFLAGGWGASYDLGTSDALGRKVGEAWKAGRVVGGVCHGPLGLLKATDEAGAPLVRGRRLSAVTDKQVRELGITVTPMHPERELRAAGALFESSSAFRDIFADHVTRDGRLVTGQNQNAGPEVAAQMMLAAGARASR